MAIRFRKDYLPANPGVRYSDPPHRIVGQVKQESSFGSKCQGKTGRPIQHHARPHHPALANPDALCSPRLTSMPVWRQTGRAGVA